MFISWFFSFLWCCFVHMSQIPSNILSNHIEYGQDLHERRWHQTSPPLAAIWEFVRARTNHHSRLSFVIFFSIICGAKISVVLHALVRNISIPIWRRRAYKRYYSFRVVKAASGWGMGPKPTYNEPDVKFETICHHFGPKSRK